MRLNHKHLRDIAQRVRREVETTGEQVRQRYGVSIPQQLAQMLYYYATIGAGREEYYGFEMYHPERSAEEKATYLTLAQWRTLTDRLNKRSARGIVARKSMFARVMRGSDIPVPPEVGLLDMRSGESLDSWRRREEPILGEIFDAAGDGGVVIKPDNSEWGLGILVFTGVDRDALIRTTGEAYSVERLHAALQAQGGRFVVQRRVTAHDTLRRYHPITLPTIRIVTCLQKGEPWIPRAAFKLPVGTAGVDNYHAGGFACPIDPVTGIVGRGIQKDGFDRISVHPESGVRFEGLQLPYWSDALALVTKVARLLPDLRTLGWDLAILNTGPIMLEANYLWGTDIVQRPHAEGLNKGRFKEWYETELRGRRHGH